MWQRLLLTLPIYFAVYACSFLMATLLRLDFEPTTEELARMLRSLPVVLAVKLLVLLQTREWQRRHRFTTASDATLIAQGAIAACVLLFLFDMVVSLNAFIPRSVILIDAALSVLTILSLRGLFRLIAGKRPGDSEKPQRTLIYGTGPDSLAILKTLHSTNAKFKVVGFYCPNSPESVYISGVKVYGSSRGLARTAARIDAEHVLIPSSLSGVGIRGVVGECAQAGIHTHVIPSVDEIVQGRYAPGIREVTISDLLRREPNQLDMESIRNYVTGRRVMVTGGAGSIGSEVCRQVLELRPAALYIVDQSECSIFHLEQEFSERARTRLATGSEESHNLPVEPHYLIADIADIPTMTRLFEEFQPEMLFHAAAYKHVPLMEHNPREAVRNNVLGTKGLVDLASKFEVERFVFISTDKAVRPTSLMGASKFMAEKYLQAAATRSQTQFITVRFGNVLNSAGSVVPTFRRQIQAGGPITVTHPDIERYFMTIPEAVQLVLQAGAIGQSGDVLILDMGEPVKIVDLAKDLILLSGLKYQEDIDIVFTGLRPGEKLYEELFYEHERRAERVHEKIFRGQSPTVPYALISAQIAQLRAALDRPSRDVHDLLMGMAREHANATISTSTAQQQLPVAA